MVIVHFDVMKIKIEHFQSWILYGFPILGLERYAWLSPKYMSLCLNMALNTKVINVCNASVKVAKPILFTAGTAVASLC